MNFAQRIGEEAFFEHGAHVIGSTANCGTVDVVDSAEADVELSVETEVSAVVATGAAVSAVEEFVDPSFEEPHAAKKRMAPIDPMHRERTIEWRRMSS